MVTAGPAKDAAGRTGHHEHARAEDVGDAEHQQPRPSERRDAATLRIASREDSLVVSLARPERSWRDACE